ncbi:MAG TPA: 16S rRNA (cytosine(1402)-N(4))-methyltransferase RsmH [Longimicrobiales bacterium]|nr:16S rRNA (cytosine(1402)-N(4))-methyltransferase RsmH [Longimicrobiales bacterium]
MTEGESFGHAPVMVAEVLAHLRPERGGWFFDGTVGGGGHAEALLSASAEVRLIAVDRDPEALAAARERLARFGDRVRWVHADFAAGAERLEEALTGALLDLGVSSWQLDRLERGFTFREGAPLDMRMGASGETAADILNHASQERLADILYYYGDEKRSRKFARLIAERRAMRPFERSEDLVEVIERVIPRASMQDRARVFQALRIAVNDELSLLERALPTLRDALVEGGVLVVLTYHSLEDREVKNAFREWSRACICPPELPVCQCRGVPLGETLTRKPLEAGSDELAMNPRARSARLRAWRKAA